MRARRFAEPELDGLRQRRGKRDAAAQQMQPVRGNPLSGFREAATAPLEHMITIEDCIAMCGLTEEEVLAIAEHEHIPEVAAAALAQYLLQKEHGAAQIRDMIIDDVRQAQARGDREHVRTTLHVLHHFLRAHPEARRRHLDTPQ